MKGKMRKEKRVKEARKQSSFSVEVCNHQFENGTYYAHEFEMNAKSWNERETNAPIRNECDTLTRIDQR